MNVPTDPSGDPAMSPREGDWFARFDDRPPSPAETWCSDAIDGVALEPAPEGAAEQLDAVRAAVVALGSVPALDDLTRARLVRQALTATADGVTDAAATPTVDERLVGDLIAQRTRARRMRWVAPVGAAAASVALVAGLLAASNGDPVRPAADAYDAKITSDDLDEASSPEVAPATLADFGEIADPAELRRQISAFSRSDGDTSVLESGGPIETSGAQGDASPDYSETSARAAADPTGRDDVAELGAFVSLPCLDALNPGGATPVVVATATFDAEPVAVAIANEPNRTLVFVVATDCRILANQQLATA